MANLTPKTGAHDMFLPKAGGAEDNSLESALRMTIAPALRPARIQDWQAIVSRIPNLDLIHDSYGTKGAVPTNQGQLRGYPKPTVNLNYSLQKWGNSPNAQTEYLQVTPILNNIVGYQVIVTLFITETLDGDDDGALQHQKTITFAAGSLEATSSQLSPVDGNDYQVNTNSPAAGEDLVIDVVATADVDRYWDDVTYMQLLEYIPAAPPSFQFILDTISGGNNCSGTPDENAFYAYSPDSTIVDNSFMYTDITLGTKLSTGYYVVNHEGEGIFDFFFVDSIGQVSGYTQCSGS